MIRVAFLFTFTIMKKGILIAWVCCLFFLLACEEQTKKNGKPIQLGDPSAIVTESDSTYLRNFTDDISPVNHQSSEDEITHMMVEVDSAKASEELQEEKPNVPKTIQGFTVNFEGMRVVFDGLSAHSIGKQATNLNAKSVSYVYDEGEWPEMNVMVEGLQEVRVEQRLMTRLSLEIDGERMILNGLGRFTSPWYTLAGKGQLFVSLGKNSIAYLPIEANKIKQVAQQEVQAKNWNNEKKQMALLTIKQVTGSREKPCTVLVKTIQWRVSGQDKNGQHVQKLIHFDLP